MKKLILLTAVTIFASAVCVAQKREGLKLSVGPELAFTTGSFSNTHSIGIGGTAQLEIKLQEKLQGVAYGGFMFYNGKSVITSSTKNVGQTIIPIRIGVKYFLAGSIYGSLQAGVGLLSNYYTGSAFSYSPQVGYEFETKNGKSIDATLKYDGYAKSGGGIGSFGLRIAYIF
ncbi:MAG: hypothetical protein V4685_13835 [Bacteroidota bacterium]